MAGQPNTGLIAVLAIALAGVLWFSVPERAERALDYSVKIQIALADETKKGQFLYGSGTVIGHTRTRFGRWSITHSIILTSAHVIQPGNPSALTIVWNDSRMSGKIIPGSVDVGRDLALIEVSATLPVAPLFFDGTQNGEPVIAIGNQFRLGLIISDGRAGPEYTVASEDYERFEISAPSYWGSSGGGVFAWHYGRLGLVGVILSIPRHPITIMFLEMPILIHVPVTTITDARPMRIVEEYLAEYGF